MQGNEIMEKTDNTNGTLVLKTRKGIFRIDTDNILYVESEDFYCILHLTDGKSCDYNQRLRYFEQQLQDKGFVPISRSLLVNMNHVACLRHLNDKKWCAVLKDSASTLTELPIAYRRCAAVKAAYAAFAKPDGTLAK